jgi:hypothetical protein
MSKILLPKKEYEIELWSGFENNIKECCVMFFESAWRHSIKYEIKEYSETMHKLTNNEGIILCPDCLTNKLLN